jgi:hypothetical protein
MRKVCFAAAFLLSAQAFAQDANPERVNVPLSDPSRPANVRVSLVHGSITVRGYDGKDVTVEARSERERRPRTEEAGGLRRIDLVGSGLTIEEQNNNVRVSAPPNRGVEIIVQVPRRTSLNLNTVNGRGIQVENIEGEIDAQATNGAVTLNNVSGAVVAHSLNGPLNVTLDHVAPGKPMSFSTLNGNIDVTFPPDLKANVKLKAQNGEIWTDFDIAMGKPPANTPERSDGRFSIRFDRGFSGAINGGGPEMQFTTMNGKIYIRKRK